MCKTNRGVLLRLQYHEIEYTSYASFFFIVFQPTFRCRIIWPQKDT
jgi:hypothetical protein